MEKQSSQVAYVVQTRSETFVDVKKWSYIFRFVKNFERLNRLVNFSTEILLQSETTRRSWFSCTHQYNQHNVPRLGKSGATKEMYEYDFYPSHCGEGSCVGMTKEIIEQILKEVPSTYYYYMKGFKLNISIKCKKDYAKLIKL